jgi:MFS family permease
MLAVLLLGQFMCIIDVLVTNVAMPSIAASLHASGASLQLVVGGYTIAYAMLLITGARLGDRYGRRRTYLAGVLVFTTASLACALAPDSQALIGFRLVQGAGAAVLVPQVFSIIQLNFSGPARARALSAYAAVLSGGRGDRAGAGRCGGDRGPVRHRLAPGVRHQRADRDRARRRRAPPGPARRPRRPHQKT